MNILVTGSSGFLGSRIIEVAEMNGHRCWGLNRSKDSDISCDLALEIPNLLNLPALDLVVHAAGKAHVSPRSKKEKEKLKLVNEIGTANLLLALERKLPKQLVFISTVAVYGLDQGENIDEQQPLKGKSVYATSKIAAENILEAWAKRHNVQYYIFRLPLISGKNPPGNLGKMSLAIRNGWYFRFANGLVKKSMVGSSDVARLVLRLKAAPPGVYNLCDGINPSISDIDKAIAIVYNKKVKIVPHWLVISLQLALKTLVFNKRLNEMSDKLNHTLTFSDKKARKYLNWSPNSALEDLKLTI